MTIIYEGLVSPTTGDLRYKFQGIQPGVIGTDLEQVKSRVVTRVMQEIEERGPAERIRLYREFSATVWGHDPEINENMHRFEMSGLVGVVWRHEV